MSILDPKQDAAALAGVLGPAETLAITALQKLPELLAEAVVEQLAGLKITITIERAKPSA